MLLGYSRIPYAAAREGAFLAAFGRLHPTRHFPHVSLLALGLLSIAGAFLRFGVVLDTLIALLPAQAGGSGGDAQLAFDWGPVYSSRRIFVSLLLPHSLPYSMT